MQLPTAPPERINIECASRAYYCDMGWVREGLAKALKHLNQHYVVPIDDSEGRLDEDMIEGRRKGAVTKALPHMRFLQYESLGACLPPHIDLSRRTSDNLCSTHTFLLYLTDCPEGGETRLLKSLNPGKNKSLASTTSVDSNTTGYTNIRNTGTSITDIINPNIISTDIPSDDKNDIDNNILATIVPIRGRLLVFPHICYHEGNKAISLPKLLLRGEMI